VIGLNFDGIEGINSNMTAGMVATTLSLADMHNCPELKKKCLDYIVAGEHRGRVC